MTAVVVVLALAFAGAQGDAQETRRVPEDSVELTVVGCLKGRVLSTAGQRQPGVERGPYVGERVLRLNGSKDLMAEVKKRNRQLVEVVGLVKRSALDDKGVKAGPFSISGGSPAARGGGMPTGVEQVPVMDASAVRVIAGSCRAD